MSKKKQPKPKKPRYRERMKGYVPLLERKRRAEQSARDTGYVMSEQERNDYRELRSHYGLPDIDEVYEQQHGRRRRVVGIVLVAILAVLAFFIGALVWRMVTG